MSIHRLAPEKITQELFDHLMDVLSSRYQDNDQITIMFNALPMLLLNKSKNQLRILNCSSAVMERLLIEYLGTAFELHPTPFL